MTREEAIERIKSRYDKWALDDKDLEAIQCAFPELSESEDERIRKEIYDFLLNGIWNEGIIASVKQKKKCAGWLAWLEKQKEPTEELVYRMNGLMQEYIREGADEAEIEHRFKCYQLFWDALEDEGFFKKKQKEQKPVEIDDEIKRWMGREAFPEGINITPLPQAMEIVKRTAKHFFELGEKTVPSPGGYWEGFKHGVIECQDKIRDVEDTMKEQKPAIRSQKDLWCAMSAWACVRDSDSYSGEEKEYIRDFLERCSLKPKPAEIDEYEIIKKHITGDSLSSEVNKRLTECGWYVTEHKPVEWSEEEEEMIQNIIDLLDPNITASNFYEIKNWLKSLPERFNLQPKQEWSEKDKQKLNRIYEILGYAADDKGFLTSKRIIGDKEAIELQDFLKSLRPHSK